MLPMYMKNISGKYDEGLNITTVLLELSTWPIANHHSSANSNVIPSHLVET